MATDWKDKRVLILGAARQGVALARWLSKHGATVTLSDKRGEAELTSARASLQGLPVEWAMGGHPLELLEQADAVCLSGGVPTNLPIVEEAAKRGIELSNDTQIFMAAAPCRTVGITGSAGKTTTTSLVGKMAHAAENKEQGEQRARTYVGGNIGDPLISYVDEMKPTDLAILEISSFQLKQMTRSPNISAVLNITPNHLDRHGSMQAYRSAKSKILEYQSSSDTAVLGRDDAGAWSLREVVRGDLHSFGFSKIDEEGEGTYYDDGLLVLYEHHVDIPLLRRDQIKLRGAHNVMNVLAAFAIGHAARLPLDAMLTAAEEFEGVAHRLEFVRNVAGVCWYNDSIATAPERTMAAIHAFEEPIVLLLGGRDKNLPWESLADLVHQRVDHVVIFGEAADKIEQALESDSVAEKPYSRERVSTLQQAIRAAHGVAQPGDVVLLSPGGTSFDEFKDFEERGEKIPVMGAGTIVNERNFADAKPAALKPRAGLDLPLLVTVIALVIFGLVMMFSASWDYSLSQYDAPMYMFQRQVMWLAIGLVTAVVMSVLNYHYWRKLIVPTMGLTILLLVVVLVINEIRLGAARSLYQGSYQPSELAKLVTIIYLSVWLYAKRELLHDLTLGLFPLGVILGVIGGLIYQQPDLSAAATVLVMGGLLFFLAGGALKQIGVLLVIAVAAGWLVVQISPTGHARVAEFMAGLKDPTQASYHVQRSFEAIVNGGWFGVGIGKAASKLTGLPVPPTDSIFAVIVEELGVVGALALITLYSAMIWRGLLIARRAPDMLGTLLATGLVMWIGLEAGINMMVMVGLVPFAGNALPFVSAGGSNLVSSLAAVGILLNISRQRGETNNEEEWRSYSAAVDLRRWDRRRRVPRARRAPRTER